MAYPITIEDVFKKSNNGLDIFAELFNISNPKLNFKLRDERHASAGIFQHKESGVWLVKDHGDTGFYGTPKNAVDAYMHEKALGFYEAITELAKQYGVIAADITTLKNFRSCTFAEFAGKLNDDHYEIVTKDFTAAELDVLGPLVTPELCDKYNIFSVKEYSWLINLKKDENPNTPIQERKVGTKFSTDFYPIFALIIKGEEEEVTLKSGEKVIKKGKDFVKILQPKDTESRFRYFGSKTENTIFGLKQLQNSPKPKKEVPVKDGDGKPVMNEDGTAKVDFVTSKHPRVFICCGERDSLNVASLGAPVVWFNSETAQISDIQIKMLYKEADEILYVPDMDTTGREQASKLALEFINLKIVWLPKELEKKTSWKNSPLKDFTDWIKSTHNKNRPDDLMRDFNILVENALTAKFWNEEKKYDRNGNPTGQINYYVDHVNAFHFLHLNGIHKMVNPRTDEISYVQQDNHVIRHISTDKIKGLFLQFVKSKREKQGTIYFPKALLNMLYTTEAISDKKLTGLDEKTFDFTNNTPESQYLFFDKFSWNITKDGIKLVSGNSSRFCYEENTLNNIIEHQWKKHVPSNAFKIENDYFKITKDKNGNWDIDIIEKDCDFLNYLINTSRVYWKEEINNVPEGKQEEYLKKYKFSISGGLMDENNPDSNTLSADQIYEQKLHLINKIFAYGYLGHDYKSGSKPWIVYSMDNEVSEDGDRKGRSGKSLTWHRAMFILKNGVYIGATNPKIIDNEFLFSNVNENTRYVLFDDADRNFQFHKLYTYITGDLDVNPKGKDRFVIPFFISPKFSYSTNFAPVDLHESSRDRILFTAYSSWYHTATAEMKEHKPTNDFGYEFFSGWNNTQWNRFINFSAQAIKFYLGTDEKIGAPENNIRRRNLMAEMTNSFYEWAIDYFTPAMFNVFIDRKSAMDDLLAKKAVFKNITAQQFKKKIDQYCELNGYELNPKELINDHKNNRITKWNKETNSSPEVLYIRSSFDTMSVEPNKAIQDSGNLFNSESTDDLV